MALLQAAGLKAVPTGLDHGTVTAISGHLPFEITTLRRVVETDGRRARVAFTDDWQTAAARREFTPNAMSCTAEGSAFDPSGGSADLVAARARSACDHRAPNSKTNLRVLRSLRLQAQQRRVAQAPP